MTYFYIATIWSTPFVVESTAIESAAFAYKTDLSKVNVKTNKTWGVLNGSVTKNADLPLATYFLKKINSV